MDLMAPLAHVGHWYIWFPYVIPVVVVLAVSIRALVQQRREDREREETTR
jgi:heme exporter protein D